MKGTGIMRSVLERESISPTKASVQMGHGRSYLNTLINEGRDCKLSTLAEFCEATGYEVIVRSKTDGFEFEVS